MIRYRSFRNTDPPRIVELWCHHPPQRSLVQPMSCDLLEERVLGKLYFDRHGLIVAEEEDGRLAGFVHAGFGTGDGESLDYELGVICMLMVSLQTDRDAVAHELIRRAEQYLIDHGALRLQGGSAFPANPYYLGLYGGSESPGILESDHDLTRWFRDAGYVEQSRHVVMQRTMAGFRPCVDMRQMQIRRNYQVLREIDPRPRTWWEACTICLVHRTLHRLVPKDGGGCCGSVTFWDMERISTSAGVRTKGIIELAIAPHLRGQGLGTYLLGNSLQHMHEQGMAIAEVQFDEHNRGAAALFQKLGFQEIDGGSVFQRSVG